MLGEGGRLAIVTFHSLEDRIVKQFFASRSGHGEAHSRLLPGEPERPQPTFIVPGKQPVLPSAAEMSAQSPRPLGEIALCDAHLCRGAGCRTGARAPCRIASGKAAGRTGASKPKRKGG